jgi:hypothetical protein
VRPQRRRGGEKSSPPDQTHGEADQTTASTDAAPSGHPVISASAAPRPWVIGERVRLRKPHPCGATDWRITRVGADIRITCEGCGHGVMLARDEFNRRVKTALDGPPGR